MKRTFVVITMLLASTGVFAQNTSNSNASSNTQSSQSVAASNQGVSLSNTFEASKGVQYSGEAKLLSNPGVYMGGMASGFSSDNCANSGHKEWHSRICARTQYPA